MIGNTTVTVERDSPGGLDQYGDPVEDDEYSPLLIAVEGCSVAPRLAVDPGGRAREGVVVGVTLYCPPGADIARTDRIVLSDGPHAGTYTIDGDTADWRSGLSGWDAGLAVPLTRAEG